MNILIISSPNPYKVSGTVAYDLFKGFKNKGNNTKLLVNSFANYAEKDILCMQNYSDVIVRKLARKIKKILNPFLNVIRITNPDYSIQNIDESVSYYKTSEILKKINFKPDVILYLFPQNFLNSKNLHELNKLTGAPIFWYLMDSAALTGGCHYSWDCKRFVVGCGKCPGLYSADESDQTAINFKLKQRYINKTKISLVAATEWQYQLAKESLLFKERNIYKILLSIDPLIFNIRNKKETKKEIGVPENKKIIFFGAAYLDEKRKGMQYLISALKILYDYSQVNNDDILLLIAGNNFETIKGKVPFQYKYLGLIENNERLALAFQAADMYVCPSIEDSGPMMINQSIMCGTPVVAFRTGVALDLVITEKTGYLAKLKDSKEMAMGIASLLKLTGANYSEYSHNCRKMALNLFTPDIQIEMFDALFNLES